MYVRDCLHRDGTRAMPRASMPKPHSSNVHPHLRIQLVPGLDADLWSHAKTPHLLSSPGAGSSLPSQLRMYSKYNGE